MKKESEFKLKTTLKIQEGFEKEVEAKRVDDEIERTLDAVHLENAQKEIKSDEDPSKNGLAQQNKQLENEIT